MNRSFGEIGRWLAHVLCAGLLALTGLTAQAQTPVYSQTTLDAVTGDNGVQTFTVNPGGGNVTCTNCYQPDIGADKYTKDLYERPMGSGTSANAYAPALDITSTQIGADATYFYFRINMFPTNPTPNAVAAEAGLPYSYAWEINFDGAGGALRSDARADLWISSVNPRDNIGLNWSNKAISAYLDLDNDAGGTSPLLPQGPGGAGNGYEREVFKEGANLFGLAANSIEARIAPDAGTNNRSLELRILRTFLDRVYGYNSSNGGAGSIPVVSASFRGSAADGGAGTNNANLLLHDKFGRLAGGSPYPWLTTAPTISCPNLDEVANGTTAANQAAFDSGTNSTTATPNNCWPSGGNIFRFDNSGSVDDLANGTSFYLDPTLAGTVFEDVNYGGGAGRPLNTATTVVRPNARVELFNAAGAFVSATTTDALGNYLFIGLTRNVNYTVRVVNSTVTSSRTGAVAGLLAVQTFRTSGLTANVGIADDARVGGEAPQLVDAGNAALGTSLNTSTGVFTAGVTGQAQSISTFTVGTANITGINFGFNFDTIVNVNDLGQGSLRQFILNSNALGALATGTLTQAGSRINGVTGAIESLPAGVETSIFMIPSGSAVPGLRAGLTNQLTAGVAQISPTTALTQIAGANASNTAIDGGTQTFNVGNNNSGVLGAGGTVGVDAIALGTVQRPEVQISDGGTGATGIDINANSTIVRGVAIYGFGSTPNSDASGNILVRNAVTGTLIEQNMIGSTASSFAAPALVNGGDNIRSAGADGGIVRNNLIGYAAGNGIGLANASNTWTVQLNEIRGNGVGNTLLDGIDIQGGSGAASVLHNLIAANVGAGLSTVGSAGAANSVLNNTLTGNGTGAGNTPGVHLGGGAATGNATVDRNIISANVGAGVMVNSGATGNVITKNSIFANGTASPTTGQIGIDLLAAGDNQNTGTSTFVTINDSGDADVGGNGLLNFPVLQSAAINAGNLTLTGFARPGSVIELFIAAPDPSGFGEGQTFLVTLTEGSATAPIDGDGGTGTYGAAAVNGVLQGTDNTSRFSFTIPTPAGVTADITVLTATATLGGNTSEFSGNVTVTGPPSLVFLKTVAVFSDPFNGATNPKNIPGAFVDYTLRVTNTGTGTVTADSIVIVDPIPANTELFVNSLGASPANSPVAFVNSVTPPSGVTFAFTSLNNTPTTDDIEFSNQAPVAGVYTFGYVPVPNALGVDPAVTAIQLNPKGTMAGASGANNSFVDLRFRVRVK